jgi:hypothetical protein
MHFFLMFFFILFLAISISQLGTVAAWAAEDSTTATQDEQLPLLQPKSPEYRTPRIGEGFRAELFGREITVRPEDRRSVSDLDVGLTVNLPDPESRGFVPFGSIYLWRHPDDRTLLRADLWGYITTSSLPAPHLT